MRVLGSAVLAMEFFVMGFALLIAREKHGALAITIGALLALAVLLTAGLMKRMTGWYLGTIWQISLIAYGIVVPAMYFLGVLFSVLWVSAYVIGRKGEAIRAELLANRPVTPKSE